MRRLNNGAENLDVSVSVSEIDPMEEGLGEEFQQDEVVELWEFLTNSKSGRLWAIDVNKDMVKSVKLKWNELRIVQKNILGLLAGIRQEQMRLIDPLRLEKDRMQLDLIFSGVLDEILRLNSSMWHLKNDYTNSKLTIDPDQAPEEKDPPPLIKEDVPSPFVEDKEVELDTMEQGDYKRSIIALLDEKIKELYKSYPEEDRDSEFSEGDFFVVVDSFSTLDETICLGIAGNRRVNLPCTNLIPFSCKLKLTDGSYSVEEFSKAEEWRGLDLEGAVPQFIYSIGW